MKVLKYLDLYFEEILIACLLGVMVLMCGMQVVFRYVLNSSLAWTEELARYSYVWSGFLSISYCIRHQSALRLDFLVTFLPDKVKRILNYLILIFCIGVFCIFLKGAVENVLTTIEVEQRSTALQIPMEYIYASGIAGFIFGILRSIQMIIRSAMGLSDEKEPSPEEEVQPIDFDKPLSGNTEGGDQ